MNKEEIIKAYQIAISEVLNGSTSLSDLDKMQLTFALAKDYTYPMDKERRKGILDFIEEVENFTIDNDAILWEN